MIILITLLALLLIYLVSEYQWRGALIFTIIVGFMQDPIRKASEIDSSYFGVLSLVCFLVTFILLKSKFRYWNLGLICWSNPGIVTLMPVFVYILAFQALNSFGRFGDLRLTLVGILFYTLPLIAFWVGFHIGCDNKLLRTFILVYVSICSLWALSILFSLSGFESSLLKEVGGGIEITGIGAGQSGFWRTSEIAGWHLAAGACFSFILGMTESKDLQRYMYFFLSTGLTFLTVTTGRRKALGMVIVFISMYLLYYTLSSKGNRLFRALSSLGLITLLTLSSYGFIFNERFQANLTPYFNRSATLTTEESQERLSVQGIGALVRGFEIGGLFGFGVGSGSNSGSTGIGAARSGVQSLAFVSEGGGGRVIVELGALGAAFLLYLFINIGVLYFRNYRIAKIYLSNTECEILTGLVIFTVVNIISFFSASQLYSDPFVLIIIGLSCGTFLAVPYLASKNTIIRNN
ncbi:MAG: hypothetical protein ACK5Q7_01925 [Cyanobacteriota bacterium]